MGDPFSIATGVAGLVSLGLTVCNGLHTYFSVIKDRKDDLAIVTQNLALFKFHILAVQSSASKLSHRHSTAIDGLQLSLINCEMQLKSLETLLNELRPTEDPSLAKDIWRKQKLIVRYPFDRKKLVQLEEYLSRANTTLSSFIQALNLDINIRLSDELEAFRTSLEALDINTQTTLRTITARMGVIGPKVEPSSLQLLSSTIEDITASSSNSVVLHQPAVGVAETKTSYSGNGPPFKDITSAHSTPRYLQNAELERRLCKKLADMDCTCGASYSKASNRPTSRTYRFWGGLTVSRQGDVRANHHPGCIFFQKCSRNLSRTSVTYFGLLSLFSQSFTVSLTQDYPAGPYSVGFGLQPCNIVGSSPAFRLLNMSPQRIHKTFDPNITGLSLSHIAEYFIKELRVIYRSGKASPFDVDKDGNNVAHMCLKLTALETFLFSFDYIEALRSSDIATDAICKTLTYLADIGVPITASNFNQSLLTKSFRNLWILPSLYKLFINRDSNFYHAELAHNAPLTENIFFEHGEWVRQLNNLCLYPEFCEDIGFSELFLAILTKDHGRLQAVLEKGGDTLSISQTDLYGRNILHVCSNWPDGLKLLLQRQDVCPLMDPMDICLAHLAPLDFALFYSKIYCNSPDEWTDCDNCTCYIAVQLLLEADCHVTVGYRRPSTLASCSRKARKLFFEHLKDRRERLRNVAVATLPEETLRQYGVAANCFPDKTAVALWTELQEAKDYRDRRVRIPDSLKPCSDEFLIKPESFFEYPHHLHVVELALDYGLSPKDENGVPTLLSGTDITPGTLTRGFAEKVSMKYLDWLLRHDLNLELPLEPFQVSILHPTAVFIGDRIFMSLRQIEAFNPHRDVCISELQDSRTLLPALCRSRARCSIPCPCSSGELSRPLAHVLPGMLRMLQGQDHIDSTYVPRRIGEITELVVRSIELLKLSNGSYEQSYMAICAIHILTMMSLGVRHLPICLTERYYHECNSNCEEEEWKEILDEDRELIDQLQKLDEEFGEAFDSQNVPIEEFLRGYWLSRMEEVVGELNKPLADDDRYGLLEAGVVLDEDETGGSELRVKHPE